MVRNQRDKTMAYKLMYIPNDDTPSVVVKRLDTQLNEPTNQKSINVHKVIS